MKKLMKAIAFATVMCMLLSTAAFAQSAAVNSAKTGIDVIVDAEAGTQVALLILTKGTALADAASGNILYIDQKPAEAAGVATFADVNIGTAKAADVFVGYEGNQTVALGTVTFEAGDTITIDNIQKFESVDGNTDNDLGGGYLFELVKSLDTGRSLSKLIWAVDWTKTENGVETPGTSYITVSAEELVEYNLLGGNVYVGVAFSAGAKKVNPYSVTLGDIRVIAKTAGNGLADKEFVAAKDLANINK